MDKTRLPEARDKNLIKALHIEMESFQNDPVFTKIIEAIEDRLVFHRDILMKSKRRYSFANTSLSILIPALSAVLTWATTAEFHDPQHLVGALGLLLTIITILNSVFRPTEKYLSASHMLVRLHDWEIELVTKLATISTNPINEIYDYLKRKDHQLSELGADIVVQLFQNDPSTQNNDSAHAASEKQK